MMTTGKVLLVASIERAMLAPSHVAPRRDMALVAARLGADVLTRDDIDRSSLARLIRRIAGPPAAQAWLAFQRRDTYSVIVTDGEHVGIPLAMLLKASGTATTHLTIGHRISAGKKVPFFRWFQVHSHIDRVVVHSYRQLELGLESLGIPPEKLALLPYQVDTEFWRSHGQDEERLVCSAGLEFRDYPMLMEAVSGTDVPVVIAAASHWSRRQDSTENVDLPSNVQVRKLNYLELRDLYARSAVVVVPIQETDFQAGITTILEAMSMGKPVIVTQTAGQTDIVLDRRSVTRGVQSTPPPLSLVRLLSAEAGIPLAQNGFYIAPGDHVSMRSAILFLLDHPDERRRLGDAGRRFAGSVCSVEAFADRLWRLVREAGEERRQISAEPLGQSSLVKSL